MNNEEIYIRDSYTCQKCGCSDQSKLSIAHRIKQGTQTAKQIYKYMIQNHNVYLNKAQINKIIHHSYNRVAACQKECNDSFNIFYKPVERDNLLEKIILKLNYI